MSLRVDPRSLAAIETQDSRIAYPRLLALARRSGHSYPVAYLQRIPRNGGNVACSTRIQHQAFPHVARKGHAAQDTAARREEFPGLTACNVIASSK